MQGWCFDAQTMAILYLWRVRYKCWRITSADMAMDRGQGGVAVLPGEDGRSRGEEEAEAVAETEGRA